MGLPAQIDPDWKVNHTKETNPSKWIITNHMSLNRSGPRSTHVRVKVVAMNLAHRIPAKRWRLGRQRRRRRERIGSQDRDGAEGGVGSAPGGGVPMAAPHTDAAYIRRYNRRDGDGEVGRRSLSRRPEVVMRPAALSDLAACGVTGSRV